MFLHDVEYVIHARFLLTDGAGPGESTAKFAEMFLRRTAKGQCMMQPYLGCREFTAHFAPGDTVDPTPIPETRELGWMLHDLEYAGSRATPRFFQARLDQGTLRVPALNAEEVRA
jgi:CRISPR-associated protein Cas5d